MRKIAIALGAVAVGAVIAILLFGLNASHESAASDLEGTKNPATYVGVDVCKGCHPTEHTEWAGTGHGEDFTQFNYHGSTINLFLRYSPDPANFTPGSCAVCHVVGYNETTIGGFNYSQAYNSTDNVKLLGIQCENCHGPGSDHPGGSPSTTIVKNPTTAASCDGSAESGCHGPTGHSNYWTESKHAESLDAAGGMVATDENCQKCHTREGFVNFMDGTDYPISNPNPVDCAACHDPHDATHEYQLRAPVEDICGKCHTMGSDEAEPGPEAEVHNPMKEMNEGIGGATRTSSAGMAGVECTDCHMWQTPDVERGVALTDVIGGEEHQAHWFEPTAEACADCHSDLMSTMPGEDKPTVDIDEGEANYTLWLQWEIFEEYWEDEVQTWQHVIDSWQEDFEARWNEVNTTVAAAYDALVAANASEDADQDALEEAWALYYDAKWNLEFLEADGSKGVHNFDYALALLSDAEENADQAVKLAGQKAAVQPLDQIDYTMYFFAVIALLVVIIILVIVAIVKRPKAPVVTTMPEEKPSGVEVIPPEERKE